MEVVWDSSIPGEGGWSPCDWDVGSAQRFYYSCFDRLRVHKDEEDRVRNRSLE